jgi:hypothetical protein
MFLLMPHACMDMDARDRHPSAWVTFPNSEFDPVEGHAL